MMTVTPTDTSTTGEATPSPSSSITTADGTIPVPYSATPPTDGKASFTQVVDGVMLAFV